MKRILLCVSVWAVGLGIESARGGVISVNPISDAFGTDQPRDGNFDEFYPGSPTNIIGGTLAGEGAEYRSALEFSLSSVPSLAAIDAATLSLHRVAHVDGGPAQMDMYVHSYVGNGIAEVADLLVVHPVAGPFTLVTDPADDLLEIDVTQVVADWHALNVAYAGFALRVDTIPAGLFIYQFGSANNGNPNNYPVLTIAYTVPEPPTGYLLTGLACFLFLSQMITVKVTV